MAKDDDFRPAAGARRALKLAALTASLAGRYAGHAVANGLRGREARQAARERLHDQAGAQLARSLGELKGAVMKLGQLASQTADLLPAPIAQALESLQREAPPLPFAQVRAAIRDEFGTPAETLFAALEHQPYAAASIGQVHRGRLEDGREVVVKVQYPGVAQSCDSDLRQLRRALRLARLVQVDGEVLDELFDEIRARLHEELDYRQEAAQMGRFRDFFADQPEVVIPAVVPERSGARVLTMILEPGDSLSALGPEYGQTQRDALARTLFRVMSRSVFELGAVHADPNPANFAARPDGSLVIYDFGCVKQLDAALRGAYRDVIRAALASDWTAVDHGLQTLGVRVPGSPPVEAAFYASWQALILAPFLTGDVPFDFARSTIHQDVVARTPEVMQRLHQFQPAARTAYLDRMAGGHYWNLVGLGACIALGPELRAGLER